MPLMRIVNNSDDESDDYNDEEWESQSKPLNSAEKIATDVPHADNQDTSTASTGGA